MNTEIQIQNYPLEARNLWKPGTSGNQETTRNFQLLQTKNPGAFGNQEPLETRNLWKTGTLGHQKPL